MSDPAGVPLAGVAIVATSSRLPGAQHAVTDDARHVSSARASAGRIHDRRRARRFPCRRASERAGAARRQRRAGSVSDARLRGEDHGGRRRSRHRRDQRDARRRALERGVRSPAQRALDGADGERLDRRGEHAREPGAERGPGPRWRAQIRRARYSREPVPGRRARRHRSSPPHGRSGVPVRVRGRGGDQDRRLRRRVRRSGRRSDQRPDPLRRKPASRRSLRLLP